MGKDFEGNKNRFWKEVKRVRKGEQAREDMVKDANGQILRDGVEVRRRWAEYFEQVLNVADVAIPPTHSDQTSLCLVVISWLSARPLHVVEHLTS